MRSVAFVCAFVLLVHGDVSLPAAAPLAPARGAKRFNTRWPRLLECKQMREATLTAPTGTTAKWSGPAGEVAFTTTGGDKYGRATQPLPSDSLARLTQLTVEGLVSDDFGVVRLAATCGSSVEYEWMCSEDECSPSKTDLRKKSLHISLRDPAKRVSMEALGKLDAASAPARRGAFVLAARQLLGDVPELVAAACTLGCTPAVERGARRAAKLAATPLRFVNAERETYNLTLRDVTAVAVDFGGDDALIRIACGSGARPVDASPRLAFCEVTADGLGVTAEWDPQRGDPIYTFSPGDHGDGSLFVASSLISVHGSALAMAR